jgi:hypothetical protein
MADLDMVKYEAAVEKLCADYVVDVATLLKKAHTDATARTHVLRLAVAKIPFPKDSQPDEQKNIPKRINEILKEESVRLKGVIEVELMAKVTLGRRR